MQEHPYKNRKYSVIPYNPEWPKQFEGAALEIRTIFGGDVVDIQHIGSTSVPGMDGKPTIDILVLVNDVRVADTHRSAMEAAGYEYAGNFVMDEAYLFRKMNGEMLLSNVHVFPIKHPHVREMLGLRDYLRDNPGEVQAYAKLKRQLYAKYPNDYGEYRKEKDAYMRELMKRAVL